MSKESTGGVLSAEHRKVIEQMVGYTDLSAKERTQQVALDWVAHEDTIFAVLRNALHVLDHGGELAQKCRQKIEDWSRFVDTNPQSPALRALLEVLDGRSTPPKKVVSLVGEPSVNKLLQMRATEVIPRLFLGGRRDAEALGPRVPDDWACVSVTEYRSRYKRREELPYEPKGSLDMPFMMDGPDGWHADPHKLDLIAETIWWRLQIGKKVLVHCIHAQERTPLVIAWYLAWSGESPSMARAYDTVARLHPRTKRRDKWLRGATPQKCCPMLADLLEAASARATAVPQLRGAATTRLEDAARAWVARTTGLKT